MAEVSETEVQDFFSLVAYRARIHLRISKPLSTPSLALHYSLLAVSNLFGWAVAAIESDDDPSNTSSHSGFALIPLDQLRAAVDQSKDDSITQFLFQNPTLTILTHTYSNDPSSSLNHLTFAASDRLILAATSDGSIHIFSLYSLVNRSNLSPLKTIPSPSNAPIRSLIPNPSQDPQLSRILVVVHNDGQMRVLDCYDPLKTYWSTSSTTAAEWSRMGKRLCVGYLDGSIEFFNHDQTPKGKVDPPELVTQHDLSVLAINWLDQKNFIVTFSQLKLSNDPLTETFTLSIPRPSNTAEHEYRRIPDSVSENYGPELSPHRLIVTLPTHSVTNWTRLIISSFSTSSELIVLGYDLQSNPVRFLLEEEQRPELPGSEADLSTTSPIGLASTYLSQAGPPLIWCYTTDGVLAIWKAHFTQESPANNLSEIWTDIPKPADILEVPENGLEAPPSHPAVTNHNLPQKKSTNTTFINALPTAFNSSTSVTGTANAFGSPGGATAFGTGGNASAFGTIGGATAFGTTSHVTAFGSTRRPSPLGTMNNVSPSGKNANAPNPTPSFPAASFSFGSAAAFGKPAFGSSFGVGSNLASLQPPPTTSATLSASQTRSGFESFASPSPGTANPSGQFGFAGFEQFNVAGGQSTFCDNTQPAPLNIFQVSNDQGQGASSNKVQRSVFGSEDVSKQPTVASSMFGDSSTKLGLPNPPTTGFGASETPSTTALPLLEKFQLRRTSVEENEDKPDIAHSPILSEPSSPTTPPFQTNTTISSNYPAGSFHPTVQTSLSTPVNVTGVAFDLSLDDRVSQSASVRSEGFGRFMSNLSSPSPRPITAPVASVTFGFGGSNLPLKPPSMLENNPLPQLAAPYASALSSTHPVNQLPPSENTEAFDISAVDAVISTVAEPASNSIKEKLLSQNPSIAVGDNTGHQGSSPAEPAINPPTPEEEACDSEVSSQASQEETAGVDLARDNAGEDLRGETDGLETSFDDTESSDPEVESDDDPDDQAEQTLDSENPPAESGNDLEYDSSLSALASEEESESNHESHHGPNHDSNTSNSTTAHIEPPHVAPSPKSFFGMASSPPNKTIRQTLVKTKTTSALEVRSTASTDSVQSLSLPSLSSTPIAATPSSRPSLLKFQTAPHHPGKSTDSLTPVAGPLPSTPIGADSRASTSAPCSTSQAAFLTTPPHLPSEILTLSPSLVPKVYPNPVFDSIPPISQAGPEKAFTKVIELTASEVECLISLSGICQQYIIEAKKTLLQDLSILERSNLKSWKMGDLITLSSHVQQLTKDTAARRAEIKSCFEVVSRLESAILKADLKRDEVKRILRSHNDPNFTKVVKTRQMGPIQLSHQKAMRSLIRDVKDRIFQMTEVLQSYKAQSQGLEAKRTRMQTPSLDTINRSIRNITVGLSQYIIVIEKLNLRFRKLEPCLKSETQSSSLGLRASHSKNPAIDEVSQAAAVQALLNEHRSSLLKDSILSRHQVPLLTGSQVLNASPAGQPDGLFHVAVGTTKLIRPRRI